MVEVIEVPWNGTRYFRADIDLRTAILVVTNSKTDVLNAQKTSDFAKNNHLSIAINGGGFIWQKNKVKPLGAWASMGKGHNFAHGREITVYFSRRNGYSFRKPKAVWNAISFPNWLVNDGVQFLHPTNDQIAPRTIVGLTDHIMTFLVIEGVEEVSGATLDRASDLCRQLGFQWGLNFDGGGSSTLWANGALQNIPSDDNIPGHERPVANHLGVK